MPYKSQAYSIVLCYDYVKLLEVMLVHLTNFYVTLLVMKKNFIRIDNFYRTTLC